jgi:hypothetical protein
MRVKYRHFNCTAPLSQLKSNEVAKIRSGSGSEERGKQGGGGKVKAIVRRGGMEKTS